MKKVLLALLGIWVMVAAFAAQAPFNDDIPDKYTVKKGDTLWDISDFFLSKPWLWPEIWHVNPQVRNPHLIYPGDVISLIYLDGKPYLTLNRGRNVKLSPQIKESANRNPIPSLPLDAIDSFLSRSRVVEPGVLEAAPYVLAGEEKHLLSGIGDDFYARGAFTVEEGFFGIYRDGGPYTDPVTNEMLGIRAQDIGSAKLKFIDDEIGTLSSTRTTEEIRVSDRLLPDEERKIDTTFYPSEAAEGTEGLIISVEGGVNNAGFLDVVAINLGERDDLLAGNVFGIYKKGELVKDRVVGGVVSLPQERAGLLMVFRTFEKMSYGLVLKSNRPLAVGDSLKNP